MSNLFNSFHLRFPFLLFAFFELLGAIRAFNSTPDSINAPLLLSEFLPCEVLEIITTSGPRLKVRFFGAWDFPQAILEKEDWAARAAAVGVPMGGDLSPVSTINKAPSFLVWAVKDAESGNLDRIQMVKGWVDNEGNSQEKVFDIAWAGNRQLDQAGKLPPIGNTVDIANATYENSIGAISLKTIWTDPEFDGQQNAFYYARVLEIPTPRWSTYDAVALGLPTPVDVPATIQERAWSSPIWYTGDSR